ncbi:helix-turn-helix transcriptional regulator [Sporolactobacillus terrae]|uniref:helix-turn-helix transcriptional regulator n=1 Tax=Sporolactobacillus terrae TaxID=269673 RepID=UPI00048F7B85|nr:helix-turn-helix transcriptional regulator [Sporolactobacillus terrae]
MSKLIGNNIRNIRERNGLTQAFVSKAIGYKSASMISEIESGKKGLDAEKIPLLAKTLNVPVQEIFFDQTIRKSRI